MRFLIDEDGMWALSVSTTIPLTVLRSEMTFSMIGKKGTSTKMYLSSA